MELRDAPKIEFDLPDQKFKQLVIDVLAYQGAIIDTMMTMLISLDAHFGEKNFDQHLKDISEAAARHRSSISSDMAVRYAK